jgi:hypothetical protein
MNTILTLHPRAFWEGPLPTSMTLQELSMAVRSHYGHEKYNNPTVPILGIVYRPPITIPNVDTLPGTPFLTLSLNFHLLTTNASFDAALARYHTAILEGRPSHILGLQLPRICVVPEPKNLPRPHGPDDPDDNNRPPKRKRARII